MVAVKTQFKIEAGIALAGKVASDGIKAASLDGEAQLVDILSVPPARSGRIYRRKGGKTHQASAPGEAPAVDTGDLLQSVASTVGREGSAIVGRVGASSRHAIETELGTEKMKPRPHTSRLSDEKARRDQIFIAFVKGAGR